MCNCQTDGDPLTFIPTIVSPRVLHTPLLIAFLLSILRMREKDEETERKSPSHSHDTHIGCFNLVDKDVGL